MGSPISLLIPADFPYPVVGVVFRLASAPLAIMPMPKAAMNKNDLSQSWKSEVWLAWQIAAVQPIPFAHCVDHSAHGHFRGCVAAFDRPHGFAAGFRGPFTHTPNLLALQLDFQAWVGLDFLYYLIITLNQIIHCRAPARSGECAEFVQVGRNELLNLKNIDPIGKIEVL